MSCCNYATYRAGHLLSVINSPSTIEGAVSVINVTTSNLMNHVLLIFENPKCTYLIILDKLPLDINSNEFKLFLPLPTVKEVKLFWRSIIRSQTPPSLKWTLILSSDVPFNQTLFYDAQNTETQLYVMNSNWLSYIFGFSKRYKRWYLIYKYSLPESVSPDYIQLKYRNASSRILYWTEKESCSNSKLYSKLSSLDHKHTSPIILNFSKVKTSAIFDDEIKMIISTPVPIEVEATKVLALTINERGDLFVISYKLSTSSAVSENWDPTQSEMAFAPIITLQAHLHCRYTGRLVSCALQQFQFPSSSINYHTTLQSLIHTSTVNQTLFLACQCDVLQLKYDLSTLCVTARCSIGPIVPRVSGDSDAIVTKTNLPNAYHSGQFEDTMHFQRHASSEIFECSNGSFTANHNSFLTIVTDLVAIDDENVMISTRDQTIILLSTKAHWSRLLLIDIYDGLYSDQNILNPLKFLERLNEQRGTQSINHHIICHQAQLNGNEKSVLLEHADRINYKRNAMIIIVNEDDNLIPIASSSFIDESNKHVSYTKKVNSTLRFWSRREKQKNDDESSALILGFYTSKHVWTISLNSDFQTFLPVLSQRLELLPLSRHQSSTIQNTATANNMPSISHSFTSIPCTSNLPLQVSFKYSNELNSASGRLLRDLIDSLLKASDLSYRISDLFSGLKSRFTIPMTNNTLSFIQSIAGCNYDHSLISSTLSRNEYPTVDLNSDQKSFEAHCEFSSCVYTYQAEKRYLLSHDDSESFDLPLMADMFMASLDTSSCKEISDLVDKWLPACDPSNFSPQPSFLTDASSDIDWSLKLFQLFGLINDPNSCNNVSSIDVDTIEIDPFQIAQVITSCFLHLDGVESYVTYVKGQQHLYVEQSSDVSPIQSGIYIDMESPNYDRIDPNDDIFLLCKQWCVGLIEFDGAITNFGNECLMLESLSCYLFQINPDKLFDICFCLQEIVKVTMVKRLLPQVHHFHWRETEKEENPTWTEVEPSDLPTLFFLDDILQTAQDRVHHISTVLNSKADKISAKAEVTLQPADDEELLGNDGSQFAYIHPSVFSRVVRFLLYYLREQSCLGLHGFPSMDSNSSLDVNVLTGEMCSEKSSSYRRQLYLSPQQLNALFKLLLANGNYALCADLSLYCGQDAMFTTIENFLDSKVDGDIGGLSSFEHDDHACDNFPVSTSNLNRAVSPSSESLSCFQKQYFLLRNRSTRLTRALSEIQPTKDVVNNNTWHSTDSGTNRAPAFSNGIVYRSEVNLNEPSGISYGVVPSNFEVKSVATSSNQFRATVNSDFSGVAKFTVNDSIDSQNDRRCNRKFHYPPDELVRFIGVTSLGEVAVDQTMQNPFIRRRFRKVNLHESSTNHETGSQINNIL